MTAPRHVVITGTSSGIGYAVAERALADGWRVTGLARRAAGPADPGFTARACDLADSDATAACAASLGDVDAFVHAAGFMVTAPVAEVDLAAAEAMWRLHVSAASQLAAAFVPRMRAGGRIVLISSRAATGAAGRGQYAAAKAAQIALARSWAAELVGRGITVNTVAPGATDTPMLTDGKRASSPPRVPPIGRLIRPREVAAAVAFLLSPDAAPITGQTLVVCGGGSL